VEFAVGGELYYEYARRGTEPGELQLNGGTAAANPKNSLTFHGFGTVFS
jgi:hypothetical protein